MKRRDFIKSSTLMAAGFGLAASGISCKNSQNNLSGNGNKNCEEVEIHTLRKASKCGGKMQLSFFPYELQLRHTFTVSSYSRKTTPGVQVQIDYEGFTGYGEASMPPYLGQSVETVCSFLSRVNLEQFNGPFCIEDIMSYLDTLSEGDNAAKAAVDIALHDLVGKLLGAPWYKIWGLNPEKTPNTTYTIGIDTEEMMKTKTIEVAGKFNILKVKVGTDRDKEMIRAIREVTDLPIAVDANQGWKDKYLALDMINWLNEQGIVMIEQPMPKEMLDETAWVTENSPLPVFADESIQRLKDITAIKGAFSGINIKLMKCTGMREAWKMLNYARAEGMKVMIGCMTETSCAVSAAAQLSPAVDFADLDGNLLISNDRFSGVEVRSGKLWLPDRPGIGLISRTNTSL